MTRRVTKVAIVGRGAPFWISAAAVRRSLGAVGVGVLAIELPSITQSVDVFSAMPAVQGLHKQIGLSERALLAAGNAVPLVAQRYSNWAGAAPPFMLGYDDPPPPGADVAFVHYWIKGRQEGLKIGLEDFSFAVAAAKHGRVPVQQEQSQLTASYGYNVAALAYTQLLKANAERLGVKVERATIGSVETEGERIAAIVLSSGERVESDLFIDASGAEAALISRLPGDRFESWSEWLPCDRMMAVSGAPISPPPAFSQISAFRAGWVGLYPLQDWTGIVSVYSSRDISDREMADTLPLLARIAVSGEAVVSEIRPGLRRRSWIGNCIAVGDGAIALDPLESLGLHVTHACISHLMALFPADADNFPEAELYNRTIALAGDNMRDFKCAHYRLNRRFDEPFWDRCRDMVLPASLQRKIEVFSLTGHVPLHDEEPFEEQNWAALLIGAGLMPQGYDPRIDTVPDEAHIAKVQQRLRDIAAIVANMPTVSEFLEKARASMETVG